MLTKDDLMGKNKWWLDPSYQVPDLLLEKRDLYESIIGNLDHSLILNIVGLRRVGKSTLLRQVAGHLLSTGIKPQNVFYFLFDYTSQIQKAEFLDEVLSVYFKDILHKIKYPEDEKVYILLDEVQYIEDWQAILKRYYDLSNKQIKFIITGSQSILLSGKYHESLAGRIFDFYLPPLSFREFLRVNREILPIVEAYDLFDLPEMFEKIVNNDTMVGGKIKELAGEYLTVGQFPEIRNISAMEKKHEYIAESVIGKVLEDCVRVFNIDKTDAFKLMARQLFDNVGSIFELKNISREAGAALITLEKYLDYLSNSYLVKVFFKYHKSLIKRGRLLKKIYTTSTNFSCALNRWDVSHLDSVPQAFGKIIENMAYNILSVKYRNLRPDESISFWRQGKKEIDFIVAKDGKVLPIEVKFSNMVTLSDLKTLIDYIAKKQLDYGIVVTKQRLEKATIQGQVIYFIPYYLFLLAL